MTPHVALLVDGDNISAQHAETLIAMARKLGTVDVLRCYLNTQKNASWLAQPAFRHMHAGTGKNASDLLLTIDAMELAFGGKIGCFVIASSDADFSHLAHRLREHGLLVHGAGEEKAPAAFRAACSGFNDLDQPSRPPVPARGELCRLEETIRRVIAAHSRQGKGMKLTELAPKMHQLHGIRISTQKERTWRAYFLARPHLFDLDPRGAESHVRFRPEGFAALDVKSAQATIPALASLAPSR